MQISKSNFQKEAGYVISIRISEEGLERGFFDALVNGNSCKKNWFSWNLDYFLSVFFLQLDLRIQEK